MSDWFLWPAASIGLVLLPAFCWWRSTVARARARRLAQHVGLRFATMTAEVGVRRRRIQGYLAPAALGCATLAIMQPTWGSDARAGQHHGVDVMICLDVSRSMLARDISPDRLRRAQHEIRSLARLTRGDRLGLIVFAGEAKLAVPLTHDMNSFTHLADQAEPSAVARGGTDLGAALTAALAAFDDADHKRQIVLISDGEDLEQRGLQVARQSRQRGIAIHCLGVGSAQGSKITIATSDGEEFLRDRDGSEVVSTMDAGGLAAIAAAAGGGFAVLGTAPQQLSGLLANDIPGGDGNLGDDRKSRGVANHYQWPLLAALLLWILELSWSDRRRK